MVVEINGSDVPFSRKVQGFCLKRGGSFSKGCPNFGKKPGCPPQPLIDKVLDLSKKVFVIYTDFDICAVATRMRHAHPEWTIKQCYNSRYWQQTARKIHQQDVREFLKKKLVIISWGLRTTEVIKSPEAHGVNVHELMKNEVGITLEWPPRNITRLISIFGQKKE